MTTEKLSEKYKGPCRKCVSFEWSLYTDSGMWCYYFKDEEHLDCPTRMALDKIESLEAENQRLKDTLDIAIECANREQKRANIDESRLNEVKALVQRWKQLDPSTYWDNAMYHRCADELEKALRVDE